MGSRALDDIINMVMSRFSHARDMASTASKYIALISDIIRGLDPAALTAALGAVSCAEGSPTIDPTVGDPSSRDVAVALAALYDKIAATDRALDILRAVFANNTWSKLAMYNKSSTYVLDVHKLRATAITAHNQYLSADDDAVFVAARALMVEPPVAFALERESQINKFTIWLFGWSLSTASGSAARRIQAAIERCKDNMLGSALVAPMDVLTRLRPTSVSGGDPGGGVRISNVTGSPMEFDMRGLIDPVYIEENGFKTSPLSGLTNQVLKRFNTVRRLGEGTPSDPIAAAANVETIDGTHWRALEDGDRTLSTRPSRYACLQNITAGCFDEKAVHVLNEYAALKPASTEILRGRIVDRIMKGFEARLSGTPSPAEFHAVATDADDITQVLLDTLSEYAGDASPEAICTYAAKTDFVIRSLRTEISRALDALAPPVRAYSEMVPTELTALLLSSYRSILARAVDELERSSTWNSYDVTLKELF